jgi:hypothetical protein
VTERIPISLAAASVLLVVLAIAVAGRAGNLDWLYLGGLSIALGSVGTFLALRHRRWLAATVNVVATLAGVWLVVAVTTFEGS